MSSAKERCSCVGESGRLGRSRGTFGQKALALVLSIVLAAGLVPFIPPTEQAEGVTWVSDYNSFFTPAGPAASISGSTLTCTNRNRYVLDTNNSSFHFWHSFANFNSKERISLLHDWTISFVATSVNFTSTSAYPYQAQSFGVTFNGKQVWNMECYAEESSGTRVRTLRIVDVRAGYAPIVQQTFSGTLGGQATFQYDYSKDTVTMTMNGQTLSRSNFRGTMGNSCWLSLFGSYNWRNAAHSETSTTPPPLSPSMTVTFNSMALPHYDPLIENIKILNPSTHAQITASSPLPSDGVVLVSCTVRNNDSRAVDGDSKEEFATHLKIANTGAYVTQGFTPVYGPSYPVKVDDGLVTNGRLDGNGLPVTLIGTTSRTITYYAKVDPTLSAVKLSQQLVEDSFKGSEYYGPVQLLPQRPLNPRPEGGGGKPGTDYHYTRSPKPNENGWNVAPVTVEFFPGSYDSFNISGDVSKTLNSSTSQWTQDTDTQGLSLSYQAVIGGTGALSAKRADLVKIDRTAPKVTYDEGSLTLRAADGDDSPAAVSGIWKLVRCSSSGSPLGAGDRTFPLTDGNGASEQSVVGISNGYWRAMDAAGNLSDQAVKVASTAPPTPKRPDSPGTPIGKPYDPVIEPVPDTEEGPETDDGLRTASTHEYVTQTIDYANPLFGGSLDLAEARAISSYRYAFDGAAPLKVEVTLLDASGGQAIGSFDTTKPGSCVIRTVATDAQGNRTTVDLHYSTREPAYPDFVPDGGQPLVPLGTPEEGADGTQHASMAYEVTEYTTPGMVGLATAPSILDRHGMIVAKDGSKPAVSALSMMTLLGTPVSFISCGREGDYLIKYLIKDSSGNTTALDLTYHLIEQLAPAVTVQPDPPGTPDYPGRPEGPQTPQPLDPKLPPEPSSDGLQHLVINDAVTVVAQPGQSLSNIDVENLMAYRYSFASLDGSGTPEMVDFWIHDSSGNETSSVDLSTPTTYVFSYKVADKTGNTTEVRLTYRIVGLYRVSTAMVGAASGATITPTMLDIIGGSDHKVQWSVPAKARVSSVTVDGVVRDDLLNAGEVDFTSIEADHDVVVACASDKPQPPITPVEGGKLWRISVTCTGAGTAGPSAVVADGADHEVSWSGTDGVAPVSVKVDGVERPDLLSGTGLSFKSLSAHHSVEVHFPEREPVNPDDPDDPANKIFVVSTLLKGGAGTITATQSYRAGEGAVVAWTPAAGQRVRWVLVDGKLDAAAKASGTVRFDDIAANHSVEVVLGREQPLYRIHVTWEGDGTAGASALVQAGSSHKVTWRPYSGRTVLDVQVDGQEQAGLALGRSIDEVQFNDIQEDHQVHVVFSTDESDTRPRHNLTIRLEGGPGTTSGSGAIPEGETGTAAWYPAQGWKVESVLVDGEPRPDLLGQGSVEFSSMDGDHEVVVNLVEDPEAWPDPDGNGGSDEPGNPDNPGGPGDSNGTDGSGSSGGEGNGDGSGDGGDGNADNGAGGSSDGAAGSGKKGARYRSPFVTLLAQTGDAAVIATVLGVAIAAFVAALAASLRRRRRESGR